MPNTPIQFGAAVIDMSQRMIGSTAIVASPALAAETTICTITIPSAPTVATGIFLTGWCAFIVGTSGTAANLRIRQTGTSGAVVAATGAQVVSATNPIETGCQGIDAAPLAAGVYVLTLIITAGAAASTVSAVNLVATIV